MKTTYPPDVNDRFVRSYTCRVARAIVAQGVFPESDFEDLVQELKLAVIEGVPRFNPERAKWSTFVRLVVRGRAVSLQRKRLADCRAAGRDIVSLDDTIEDEDGQLTTLANRVREDQSLDYVARDYVSDEDRLVTEMDIATVVASLPSELRDLCERLTTRSVTQVARDLGVPRTTLTHQLKKIREAFVAAGFDSYGKNYITAAE